MERVWDYSKFVVWFLGLGYFIMWLIGSFDDPAFPPGVHLLGLGAAAFVAVRVMAMAFVMMRIIPAMPLPVPTEALQGKAMPPLPTVRPRRHFGLRGAPD